MARGKAYLWHLQGAKGSYDFPMSRGTRILQARIRKNLTQQQLADLIPIDQKTIVRYEQDDGADRKKHLERIASVLEVPLEWLTVGDNPPPWVGGVRRGRPASLSAAQATDAAMRPLAEHRGGESPISVVGKVTAGNGLISYEESPREFVWKSTWAVMQVEGNSAYPVAFENQFVIVDTHRETHHNNIVVIQVLKPGETKHRCYVKRYCVDEQSPSGYVLASVNGGIDSPWIPRDWIIAMVPVVGVIFEE